MSKPMLDFVETLVNGRSEFTYHFFDGSHQNHDILIVDQNCGIYHAYIDGKSSEVYIDNSPDEIAQDVANNFRER